STSPQEVLQKLQSAGVQAEGSNPTFHYTHEKAMIIDGATLFVMSCNLTYTGLGGGSDADRDYGVIDTNSADVQEAANIFNADWQRQTPTLTDPNLVVSPVNARSKLAGLIGSAHHTLYVEDEEMYDAQSENELIAAAKSGVNVEVIVPSSAVSQDGSDVQRLIQGGVHVRDISTPYMHAKLIIADGSEAFVGSENFSANSLDDNRELGLLISDQSAISTLNQTFGGDWGNAHNA
ncbi:MAG TPA: phospholipase D-like domain-containing protein, partial [Ktedonobacterales bacterium]|nr:phospholipase D-like domain-containing protein [Ktedonobacterales bacterium]